VIKRLYHRWKFRDYSQESLAESYAMLIKLARRCAHDLDHAVSFIPEDTWPLEMLEPRSRQWLKIFSPSGVKNYRTKLHDQLDDLEMEVALLRRQLENAGIKPDTIRDIPF
jgi:hypothetical protein